METKGIITKISVEANLSPEGEDFTIREFILAMEKLALSQGDDACIKYIDRRCDGVIFLRLEDANNANK